MQKIWLLAFSLLIFFVFSNTSFVQASDSSEKVNYELPYPGLLPDSPLYFLRVIRDRAVSFLISDPLKKAEFDLLQADKRLNAGIYLLNKGKVSMSLSTVSKAENYLEESLGKMGEAKNQGRNISKMGENLRNALKKHKQELGYLSQKATANFKANFEREQKRVTGFEDRLRFFY